MKFLLLLKFAISQTPVHAINILRKLNPRNWQVFLDGTEVRDAKISFSLADSFKEKALVATIAGKRADDSTMTFRASSKLKSEGDTLLLDNATVAENVGFDLDVIGWTDTVVQVEMRYSLDGIPHELKLVNQF